MPFDTLTRFPCGEYKPGYEPRASTPTPNLSLGVYVPAESNGSEEPIFVPNDGRLPPKNVQGPAVPGGGGGGDGGGNGGGGGGGTGGGGPAGPGRGPTQTPTAGGPATPGPQGPGGNPAGRPGPYTGPADVVSPVPGPMGPRRSPTRGPTTPRGGIPDLRWKCSEIPVTCPDDANLPLEQRRILKVERSCIECPDPPIGQGWPGDCKHTTLQNCVALCRSSQPEDNPCVSRNTQQQQLDLAKRPTSVTNAAQNSQRLQSVIPKKQVSTVKLNTQENKGYATNYNYRSADGGLYDPYYNFFKTKPDQTTKMYSNDKYLNIFSNNVAYEILYFLNRQNNSIAWHEVDIHNLTTEKISVSLKLDLLTALNNIQTVGNKKIIQTTFYNTIRRHLVEGSLSEFDPDYFLYIYNNQIQDAVFEYDEPGDNKNALDAAFALFESNSKKADYNTSPSLEIKNDYKRMRFLLEDIEANIPTTRIDGTQYPLYLNNLGVPVEQIDPAQNSIMGIGDGAGYYVSTLRYDGLPYPLPTENSLSNTYFLDSADRARVMRILGKDSSIKLISSSVPYFNEFSSSFNASAELEPMYFVLNLETLGELDNPDSVINVLSATYTRVTNEQAINHSRNHSFNLTKVNVDYRDPFIHYARDTSTINLELNEFNLRNFGETRTIYSNKIMARIIPFGFILTPGCGSYHNPFNSRSTVLNYEGPVVARSLSIKPSINLVDTKPDKPFLNSSRIYLELGIGYYGLYEQYLDQDINGRILTYDPSSAIFDKSYYYNGKYTNVQPPSSMRENSTESKFMNLVNKLTSLEGVSELTWWDVFRRMNATEIGALMNTKPQQLIKKLGSGLSNGVPIKSVLSTQSQRITGIPEDAVIADDKIIINLKDRARVSNSEN